MNINEYQKRAMATLDPALDKEGSSTVCPPYGECRNDDDLVLYFSKPLPGGEALLREPRLCGSGHIYAVP